MFNRYAILWSIFKQYQILYLQWRFTPVHTLHMFHYSWLTMGDDIAGDVHCDVIIGHDVESSSINKCTKGTWRSFGPWYLHILIFKPHTSAFKINESSPTSTIRFNFLKLKSGWSEHFLKRGTKLNPTLQKKYPNGSLAIRSPPVHLLMKLHWSIKISIKTEIVWGKNKNMFVVINGRDYDHCFW